MSADENVALEVVRAWCSVMSEGEGPDEGDMRRLVEHMRAAILPPWLLKPSKEAELCAVCERPEGGPHEDHCVTDEALLWRRIAELKIGFAKGSAVVTQFVALRSATSVSHLRELAKWLRDQEEPVAIPMRIPCPSCGKLHIDEGEFATKIHHTHSCQHCGLTWRPAVVPTVGVRFLPGFKNMPLSEQTAQALDAGFATEPAGEPQVGQVWEVRGVADMGGERQWHTATVRRVLPPSEARSVTEYRISAHGFDTIVSRNQMVRRLDEPTDGVLLSPAAAEPVPHDTGHPHLINGEFQSDKYPTTPRGKVPLSCKDPTAQDLLWEYAQRRRKVDAEFATDLELALLAKGFVRPEPGDQSEVKLVHDFLTIGKALIDRDQTGLAHALGIILRECRGSVWITEGRGAYEWDDDRYRAEMGAFIGRITDHATEALARSGSLANIAFSNPSTRPVRTHAELEGDLEALCRAAGGAASAADAIRWCGRAAIRSPAPANPALAGDGEVVERARADYAKWAKLDAELQRAMRRRAHLDYPLFIRVQEEPRKDRHATPEEVTRWQAEADAEIVTLQKQLTELLVARVTISALAHLALLALRAPSHDALPPTFDDEFERAARAYEQTLSVPVPSTKEIP